MIYITTRQNPVYRQMTLEELLFGGDDTPDLTISDNRTGTRTYTVDFSNERMKQYAAVDVKIRLLRDYIDGTKALREVPRESLYRTFYIPKKSHGVRRIDAPNDDLMGALRVLKRILTDDFGALYHTSAYAYVPHRNTVDAVKRHQMNESRWFLKLDLHNFFGSTTKEFAMKMLSMVYPFSELFSYGAEGIIAEAIDLAFLNGGLPQGTPLSPALTNILMIPIDHTLSNSLRDFNKQTFVYTRYADDFLISSRYDFKFRDVEEHVKNCLESFGAPFNINGVKTRYGSSSGQNWNLGVMLNKDNKITIGRQNKKRFESMLHSYACDKKNGIAWDLADVQVLNGLRSYYRMVEGETIDRIVEHVGAKTGVNIPEEISKDLRQ